MNALIPHFQKLTCYDLWANQKVLRTVEEQQVRDEKVLSLLEHIAAVQQLWCARINQDDKETNRSLWPAYSAPEQLRDRYLSHYEVLQRIILSMSEEASVVTYKNTKGKVFSNLLTDILHHIFNHGTYHRAQITQRMRQLGKEPAITEYIAYAREKIISKTFKH